MARNDRCNICDYSESSGSGIAGVNPGAHGKVRRFAEEYYCDVCSESIRKTTYDIQPPDITDEDLVLLEE